MPFVLEQLRAEQRCGPRREPGLRARLTVGFKERQRTGPQRRVGTGSLRVLSDLFRALWPLVR